MVIPSRTFGEGYTPICSDCGIALCWDIGPDEYDEAKPFWDNWKCKECNPDYRGALKKFNIEQNLERRSQVKLNQGTNSQ